MKKITKIPIIAIFFAILFFAIPVFAANETGDANLSVLGIKPNDFSGFKESKTEYSTTVPNTTKEIEVYAKAKDSKAKITGTGKLKLEEGQNTAKVVVTAQNGTKKTYTINIKRLKGNEKDNTNTTNTTSKNSKTETATKTSSKVELESLNIEGVTLEPEFNKEEHQYKIYFDGEQEKLNIKTEPSGANVQIIGNENLVDGENLITIMVSDKSEKNISTYQIYANKNVKPIESNNFGLTIDQIKQAIIIGGIAVGTIIILIIIIAIARKIKNKNNDEDEENEDDGNEFEVDFFSKLEFGKEEQTHEDEPKEEAKDAKEEIEDILKIVEKKEKNTKSKSKSKKSGKHSK